MLLYTQQASDKCKQMQKSLKKSLDKLKTVSYNKLQQQAINANKCKQMQKSLKNRLTR